MTQTDLIVNAWNTGVGLKAFAVFMGVVLITSAVSLIDMAIERRRERRGQA